MYVIYHDIGGTYGAVIAAAIHLSQLPREGAVKKEEIQNFLSLDKFYPGQEGHLVFHGKDCYENEIYSLGRRYAPRMFLNALHSTLDMSKQNPKQLLYVDTMETVNLSMIVGGTYARRAGLLKFSKPLLIYGLLKAYPKLQNLVWKTELKSKP